MASVLHLSRHHFLPKVAQIKNKDSDVGMIGTAKAADVEAVYARRREMAHVPQMMIVIVVYAI